jgi:hypothetical protein
MNSSPLQFCGNTPVRMSVHGSEAAQVASGTPCLERLLVGPQDFCQGLLAARVCVEQLLPCDCATLNRAWRSTIRACRTSASGLGSITVREGTRAVLTWHSATAGRHALGIGRRFEQPPLHPTVSPAHPFGSASTGGLRLLRQAGAFYVFRRMVGTAAQ